MDVDENNRKKCESGDWKSMAHISVAVDEGETVIDIFN